MLQKEVKILEKLKHPNICQLKEVFYEEDYISEWVVCCLGRGLIGFVLKISCLSGYLVAICLSISWGGMGSVRGFDYAYSHLLTPDTTLGEDETRHITYQLCDALAVGLL